MGILRTVLRPFIWWDGQTVNTRIHTWLKGVIVGRDDQGNVFYRSRDGRRRWVIYDGEVEASRIGPGWHGWLHHTRDEPPTEAPLRRKAWEKSHRENLTGTVMAYAPPGSIRKGEPKPPRDYEAWEPE